ncbi:MAG: hypothetical protein A2782_03925 [Candidatus Blackburnbacteria bacterium RIFCSPHIGHO2_01_FULL_43_15b]|uniref:Uncharacterized protein n=1 Tax=Candidatus Blackburnbacteria bacterium RIFCSPHIGHO2_01_FULL_43_15b TaxID=1797513 RepID=A0A1G1UYB3_9BACT|nr:MAG: hypothetical protein A2782_03925 [Candidatus Blackburnbacteria bacterium RIFCSPHIGHO2_01_FULL_43_15b]
MIFELASIWLLVKVFYLVAFFVYVVFAAVTVKQTYLMTKTLEIGLESLVRTLSWAHFIFAVAVLVLAFVLL